MLPAEVRVGVARLPGPNPGGLFFDVLVKFLVPSEINGLETTPSTLMDRRGEGVWGRRSEPRPDGEAGG